MKKRIVIGLTGPIASGKDTVAKILARHGAVIIDADKIGHEVIKPQQKAWHGIVKAFGSKVLNKGGVINRKKLAKIVFSDISALKKLDKITHPEILKTVRRQIRAAKRKLVVINAAILAEMKLIPLVDKVIVVLAGKNIRLKRLIRSGRSRSDALARIKAQASDAQYRKLGDIVIVNNGTIKGLVKKVNRLITEI